MKNMMSQVKNCSILVFCALLLLAVGCKKEQNAPEQEQPEQSQPQPQPQPDPEPTETLAGNVARPSWTAPDVYDMTSSMTALVKVDLKAQYPKLAADYKLDANDVLGAFSGDTCLGVGKIVDGLFFIYIDATEGAVTLRYWSAQYKNLFEAKDAFPYANESSLGTLAEPLVPAFTVVK